MWGVSRQLDLNGSSQRAKALGRDVWLCGVAEGLHTWRFTEERVKQYRRYISLRFTDYTIYSTTNSLITITMRGRMDNGNIAYYMFNTSLSLDI